ncbi:MAG: hemolysin III family protein [Massilimaliae sp.]|nr:hemolysin III family protein [Massiliimalia sp.]
MPQPNKKRFLPFYTVGEEIANSVTHGLGSLLSIAGCAVMIVFAALTGDPFKIVSAAIFGAGLIIMFTMSTLYHSLTNEKAKFVFRVFDHTSIFILIAATYTPLTLVSLRGWIGWTIFGVVWGSAIVGIILNAVSVERFKVLSMVCYIASGWCVIAAIVPLIQRMESMGVALLVLGGIAYTGGLFFYRKKEIRYMHSVWHLFVLAGAVFHYFCILFYVV